MAHGFLVDGRARYVVSNLAESRLLQEGEELVGPLTLVGN